VRVVIERGKDIPPSLPRPHYLLHRHTQGSGFICFKKKKKKMTDYTTQFFIDDG